MATNPPKRQAPNSRSSVIQWLLDSDPSIRWQVMRDLIDAPADEVAAERARVATEGVGARLLALQGADGRWGGAAWNRGWNSTMHVLTLLREMGLDPASDAGAARGGPGPRPRDVAGLGRPGREDFDGNPFFAGEVEPCINGQVGGESAPTSARTSGASSTGCSPSSCPTAAGTARPRTARRGRRSTPRSACWKPCSNTNWRGGSSPEVTAARLRGQEYLLERRLFRRRSTGEVIERDRKGGAAWTRFAFPTWWHYDVLRGLEYLRRAGVTPDERVAEAIDLVASKRDGDGRWPLEIQYPGDDAGRDGRGRGPAEPVEHAARLARVGLVCRRRLTRAPLDQGLAP